MVFNKMKIFKLIKEYPFSYELGTIIKPVKDADSKYYAPECGTGDWIHISVIEKYSEFWEEVVEKGYEILSYLHKVINIVVPSTNFAIDILGKEHPIYKIHSIKRLSDGEVFTVGDMFDWKYNNGFEEIENIDLVDNKIKICSDCVCYKLDEIKKVKKHIFRTCDGVDVYDKNQNVFLNNGTNLISVLSVNKVLEYFQLLLKKEVINTELLCFSTKEEAEKYRLENFRCLSYNDIENYLLLSVDQEKVKQLIKTRI